MNIRKHWLKLAALAVLALGVSHYVCYRRGQTEELADLLPAIEREKKSFAPNHLVVAIHALRPVAQHPDAVPAADITELCRQAEEDAKAIEQEIIPEMRESGNMGGVRQHMARIREARKLIRSIRR